MEIIITILIIGVLAFCISNRKQNGSIKEFICTSCKHRWHMRWNHEDMVPPCPICSMPGCAPDDYEDLICDHCGHQWRRYGTKAYLPFGAPICPNCKKVIDNYEK